MDLDLREVSALVTGSGAGIGRAIALRLAKGGSKVAVADLRGDKAQETAARIKQDGGEAVAVTADVSKQEDVDRMIEETVRAFGGLDVLVNNAGVGGIGFIEQVRDSEVERMFGVNLTGVLRVTRAAAPHLKKSGRGRIINISSVEGIRGSGVFPVYCMTKAGVIGLTRSNAIELARFGITVNAICPGIIDTELMAKAFSDPKFVDKAVKGIPLKRTGKPEDISGAVAFFASAESSYITGNVIVIDGGQTVKAL